MFLTYRGTERKRNHLLKCKMDDTDFNFQINRTIANLLTNEWGALATKDQIVPPVEPEYIWSLAFLLVSKKISSSQGKTIFSELIATNDDPLDIIKRLGIEWQSTN